MQVGKSLTKNQAETPYTETGRQINFERTKKKRINARFDELYSEKSARAISYGKWGKPNNFEFIMNRAYALNRDKLKCRVCGGWLISSTPWAHRINPYLPLDKVNRVNNLVSLHKKCFMAVNNPNQEISQFDVKAQKKIIGYREKLVPSYMGNTHKEVFGNLLDNRMMLWRHAVVVLLYPLNSGEKSTSPIKL
ncbi:hypothetical protein [Pseudoflavonifractor sp. 524-17]|uniref:hypothetical protein n=1 Tax=Pseudoflavonifractor sp. 524-17 TaxID=2304577 RepID=UPI001FAB78EF|nr:hypothetical protein [Pseudoflavonifractor sp. 524-17]